MEEEALVYYQGTYPDGEANGKIEKIKEDLSSTYINLSCLYSELKKHEISLRYSIKAQGIL